MVTRDAKEYPKTIPSEIQVGRPLHVLRVLSRIPLLEYPPTVRTKYGRIYVICCQDDMRRSDYKIRLMH